ncbi:unnamed protein product [Soboliphyme baturini]|uniref:Endo/exonuclease/phosphatase domain-containing protein n=1 Tax=Soboliphyme baturini TaxID=241478 RepID=A0A183J6R7_9BILA|nr:unnamed protein product [Soboliphyme baturini]
MGMSSPAVIDLTSDDEADSSVDYDALCRRFVEITGSDSACAHMFLQNYDWNLDNAVSTFFEVAGPAPTSPDNGSGCKIPEIKILSWNIDGLRPQSRVTRAKAVATVVLQELPTFVFLQEVVAENLTVLNGMLSTQYECYAGTQEYTYFTVIYVRKGTAKRTHKETVPFSQTSMGREMVIVKLEGGQCPCVLVATHLESTARFRRERISQLNEVYTFITAKVDSAQTVFFGGDLNLRDAEFVESSCDPSKVVDLWEVCGSSKATQYTWDCTKNDTLHLDGKFLPRNRFDRLYMRPSIPRAFKPKEFRLVGIHRIRATMCFPSDHFGILSVLDVL